MLDIALSYERLSIHAEAAVTLRRQQTLLRRRKLNSRNVSSAKQIV
jgi:hypothetical protein